MFHFDILFLTRFYQKHFSFLRLRKNLLTFLPLHMFEFGSEFLPLPVVFHNTLLSVDFKKLYSRIRARLSESFISFNLFSNFIILSLVMFRDLLISIVKCLILYFTTSHHSIGF